MSTNNNDSPQLRTATTLGDDFANQLERSHQLRKEKEEADLTTTINHPNQQQPLPRTHQSGHTPDNIANTVIQMKLQNDDPNVVICSLKEFEQAQARLGDDSKEQFHEQQQRHGHQAQVSSPGKLTPKVAWGIEPCSCKDDLLEPITK